MNVREINAKSILTPTKLPGADYCINPYVGCHIGCIYCYATFMKRFTNHKEDWGKFVDVKLNAPEVLEKEIAKAKKGIVFLSSTTDPYQPLEKKYELTRKLLAILLKHQFPVSILTKSSLVLRDIDLLKQFKEIEVGFSISSLNEKDRIFFEPASSAIKDKINALKTLHENKIKTYAFIGPVIPKITNVSEIIETIHDYVDFVYVESMNFSAAFRNNCFETKLGDSSKVYKIIAESPKEYLDSLGKKIDCLKNKYNLPITFITH